MDSMQILHELGNNEGLPVEALRAASGNRAAVLPAFLQAIDDFLAGHGMPETENALFFIFHLLGEWREKTAYRPLAALLRRPLDEIDGSFGGAITETPHRVMAAVFDGDPAPLYDVIRDPHADEFVRAAAFHALAMVTMRGELSREDAAKFLRASYVDLVPQDECFVWDGWQSTIAMLGLQELRPLVQQAFERGFISPTWLGFKDFEGDLQEAVSGVAEPYLQRTGNFTLFGDSVEELPAGTRSARRASGIESGPPSAVPPKCGITPPPTDRRSIATVMSAATIHVPAGAERSSRSAALAKHAMKQDSSASCWSVTASLATANIARCRRAALNLPAVPPWL